MRYKLNQIAVRAKQDKRLKFTSLVHLINTENLARCYKELKRNKACGVDQITVESYGENLNEKLEVLVESMKRKQYQPQPVKRVYIPKAGSKEKRGLGIPTIRMDCTQVQSIFGIYYYHSSISSMEWATFSNIIDKELQEPGYI
ncbi:MULTISPECIES: reverse transcriptase family protein [unclassified Wolbachia]|uniref:hypothetical protein n=1 Tax=unclassified Wolbachia TaxID=2640676 RepID=UPI0021F84723|nr:MULTISPECIES: hypothetical protein [unclassified Wolbachia]